MQKQFKKEKPVIIVKKILGRKIPRWKGSEQLHYSDENILVGFNYK